MTAFSIVQALKQLQAEKPAYQGKDGARGWWSEVIKRTAIGAGADPQGLSLYMQSIITRLPPWR
jgi:hypothetical protein